MERAKLLKGCYYYYYYCSDNCVFSFCWREVKTVQGCYGVTGEFCPSISVCLIYRLDTCILPFHLREKNTHPFLAVTIIRSTEERKEGHVNICSSWYHWGTSHALAYHVTRDWCHLLGDWADFLPHNYTLLNDLTSKPLWELWAGRIPRTRLLVNDHMVDSDKHERWCIAWFETLKILLNLPLSQMRAFSFYKSVIP